MISSPLSVPQADSGIGPPWPPIFSSFQYLLLGGSFIALLQGFDDTKVGGRKGVRFAQATHGDIVGSPVADARNPGQLIDKILQVPFR